MQTDYPSLRSRINALCEGETDVISKMATVSCELFHNDDRFDWVGFYRVTSPEMLKIGPYQGGHGCLTIPFSRGVCGAAATTRKIQLIDDVNAFDGHIACATSTQSEIVLPVFDQQCELIAVLDIDSNQLNAFTKDDALALTQIISDTFQKN